MIEGKYIYKCKNCGEKFLHSSASSYSIMQLCFHSILATGHPPKKQPAIGTWPKRFEMHDCDAESTLMGKRHNQNDKIIGVAELVGLYKRYGDEKG